MKGEWSDYLPDKIGLLVVRLWMSLKATVHSWVVETRKNNVNEKEIIHYEKNIFRRVRIRKGCY